ncbi:MAG: hypothetical protein K2N52_03065, partial [Clostridia bacterium]|nr:hypothetical protein [Clostridia bacterium]
GSPLEIEAKEELCDGRKYKLIFNLRPLESAIFEVPYHESTPEENEEEKKVRNEIQKAHKEAKTDISHIPQVEIPAELAEKPKAKTAKKK